MSISGPYRRRASAIAAALLLGIGASVAAQTAPELPEQAKGPLRAVMGLVTPTLEEASGLPAEVTSALLAAAPVIGPLYAEHTRGLFEPPVAIDLNPDPDVVEVVLVAIPAIWEFTPGIPTLVWSFNGTIPGPTIEAKVGDEVIVHFTNLIDTPGGIHWHGVEVPATMDGSHTSNAALALGESFDYRFRVNRASLFWYHPHHAASEQVERGLYGALLVHDPADEALGLPANETIVVLDDVLLDADGQFDTFDPARPTDRAAVLANGREGNILVVNGGEGRTLPVEPGAPLRLRMVNVANSRFMRLSVPPAPSARGQWRECTGADRAPCHDLWEIGSDGGLLEAPRRHEPIIQVVDPDPSHFGAIVSDNDPEHGILLTPGARADVILTPTGASGDLLPVEWHDWGRGRHFFFQDPNGDLVLNHVHGAYPSLPYETLFDLQIAGEGQAAGYTPPAVLRSIEPLPTDGRPLALTMGHLPPERDGDITFFMQTRTDGTPLPFPLVEPADAHQATVGETAVWEVTNLAHGDHNFHTHGFMFQPLEVEYVTCPEHPDQTLNRTETFDYLQERDTVLIPGPPAAWCVTPTDCRMCAPGTARTILRAAVRFDGDGRDVEAHGKIPTPERSGGWMVHCHILEHAARGMMSFFELRNP